MAPRHLWYEWTIPLVDRLTGLSIRHPGRTLALWVVVVGALIVPALDVATHLTTISADVRGTKASVADTDGARAFGRATTVTVLLTGPRTDLQTQAGRVSRALVRDDRRRIVISPFDRAVRRSAPGLPPALRPTPRSAGLLVVAPTRVSIDGRSGRAIEAVVRRTVRAPVRAHVGGFSLIGGEFIRESQDAAHRGETYAVPALLIVLLLVFRSLVAAALPLILGIATVLASTGAVSLLARVVPLAEGATAMSSMMGLAIGVDYSLLIVSRFREERVREPDLARAALAATCTAGRTVLFAGGALVFVAGSAALIAPNSTLSSCAAGSGLVALFGMAGALTAIPALLVLVGPSLERWKLGSGGGRSWMAGLALFAQRHPLLASVPAIAVMALLLPFALGLKSGAPDPRTLPADNPARVASTVVAAQLGPGWLTPMVVDVSGPRGLLRSGVYLRQRRAWLDRVRRDPQVVTVFGAQNPGGRGGVGPLQALTVADRGPRRTTRFFVVPRLPPTAPQTVALLGRLRAGGEDLARTTGAQARVGGLGAQLHDTQDALARFFPVLVLALALISMVALTVILRAPVLAFVSTVLNLATIGAAVGALGLLFTGGNPPLGGPGFVDQLSLLVTLSVVFALSLDYQVFILARVREEWLRSGDEDAAVGVAIRHTARVVTGAAAIMAAVFLGFAVPELQTLRQIGVTLGAAVLIDATLVRCVLLPAIMRDLGRWNFWLPAWLDRLLPTLDLEGTAAEPRPAAAGVATARTSDARA
jgi:RND superfamily putative drug exporter